MELGSEAQGGKVETDDVRGDRCGMHRARRLLGVLVFSYCFLQSSVGHATMQQAAAKGSGSGVQVEGRMIRG